METWVAKVIALSLLFVSSLVFGLIPIQCIKSLWKSQAVGSWGTRLRVQFFVSMLNCLAGGVFLGTTLLHLIPESREDIVSMLQNYNVKTDFAVAEFIIGGGFFLIMIVENIVMVLQHHQSHVPFESAESSVCCDSKPTHEEQPILKGKREKTHRSRRHSYGATDNQGQLEGVTNPNYVHEDADTSPAAPCQAGSSGGGVTESPDGRFEHHHRHRHHHHHDHHEVVEVGADHSEEQEVRTGCSTRHPPVKVEKGDCVHVIHPSHHQHHHMEPQQLASLRSFLLLLALSIHTVFEGIAIGLQPTDNSVWNLFIAIVVHKSVIAFSMGIQFAENLKNCKRAIIFIILFALMSPIGVGIGTSLFEVGGGNMATSSASAVLQAIATGTFLYVTFFEVLHKEVGQDHNLLKVLFVILGYAAMVLLNLFNSEPGD